MTRRKGLTKANDRSGYAAYRECILRSYGSFDRPSWHFVAEVASRDPYVEIREEMSTFCDVRDDTDVNCDVCFTLIVQPQGLVVRLSMVGPYAAIFAIETGKAELPRVIASFGDCQTDSERSLFRILASNGFIALSEEEMRKRLPLRLVAGEETCSIYAAFFETESELF